MFRHLRPAKFGRTDPEVISHLNAQGDAMSPGFDKPFDGPNAEESGFPALGTYSGQFIDHDITFDPDALVDDRAPTLDLDNNSGRGPDDQTYLYEDGDAFLLGESISGSNP